MRITQRIIRTRICLSSSGLTSLPERLADGEPLSLTKLSAEKMQLFGPVGSIPLSSIAVALTLEATLVSEATNDVSCNLLPASTFLHGTIVG